ncbi:hypothetical protein Phep_1742 [Pedobacter heparinus DSM 2366]|uniref:Uncharacterized protein n=1 Tax=Pedobacter heparinus (strain ATCC 13125 / DSM 2366 / CIP 104194 / JCM 7457 / NBRC 12017 / NCIMB 9290 / NRRL B-14731 / HIM 762-3) TaxID=485917 RepID=C6XV86_PEDHD|nr:hypothetical protein Phep_1742 [Pedobacter heparinus DSM 2366]
MSFNVIFILITQANPLLVLLKVKVPLIEFSVIVPVKEALF